MDLTGGAAVRGRRLLLSARVLATAFGLFQLAGVFFFTVLAPEEAVWLGPLIDVPVVAVMVLGMLLKVACGVWPRLSDERRIRVGLAGAIIGIAITLLKIPLYDEPEGVIFLAVDAGLLVLLLLARRKLGVGAGRSVARMPA
ncbi:hypothetical protein [Ornithinimicrobium tianjinense]|uniref:Uncharacterized protein n=1 Tax=Ornithinimicrobium tianjinense TaxID=1195761 RepID=A0A917BEM6_9MICO|nr:hypothetical protein [Ornithinimicrobium tianjinense]GGF40531.1 hypothetical protein GCM10011366_05190 [Ornithinimicrobium tianjinense]